MKAVKQIGYKLIVAICIVCTLFCFLASTPVEASKVNTTDFYYSGTQKGSYSVEKGFLEILIDSLGMILDYLIGIATMGFRIVLVGWTALLERCLTWLVDAAAGDGTDVAVNGVTSTSVTSPDGWITLDAIFFNQVPLLDINVFDLEGENMKGFDSRGHKIEGESEEHNSPMIINTEENEEEVQIEVKQVQGAKKDLKTGPSGSDDDDDKSLIIIMKRAVAGWYYTFRVISIMAMLVLLLYIGIQLAIKSSTIDRALYKKVFMDWVVGMILVFFIHYIMIFVIQVNQVLVEQISNLRLGHTNLEYYEYGLLERASTPISNEELEISLYDEVKTRAYDAKFTVGFTGMVMYMVLVYYAWKFTFIYLKRYLTVIVLIMVAPFVAVSYAFNKIKGGKSVIFSKWLKEYSFIVILQTIHALMYVVFLSTILAISLNDVSAILLAFMLLNFMCKAEGLFRKIFGITGSLTDDAAKGGIKDALDYVKGGFVALGGAKIAGKATKAGAKLLTKPVRGTLGFAGSKTFGAIQAHRANKADTAKGRAKAEKKDKEKLEKAKKLRLGSIAKAIQDGDIDVKKLEEAVEKYRHSEDVDQSVLDEEELALAEIKQAAGHMDEYLKEYKKQTSAWAHTKKYVGGKWAAIMEPKQYTKRVKVGQDKDGNAIYKYKQRDTKREFGHLGKKYDSVGKVFASHMNLGMDEKSKAELKVMTEFLKKEVVGFVGIMAGLPLLIAEPAAGAVFLYQGVKNTHEVFGGKGRHQKKSLKNIKLMPNGKYKLVGFEGGSVQTIANEAKREAEEQIQQVAEAGEQHKQKMIAKVKTKHPKLYKALTIGAKGAVATEGAIIGINALTAGSLAGVTVVGAAAGAGILTGAVLNVQGNLYMQMHNVKRMAYKNAAKQAEYEQKELSSIEQTLFGDLAEDYHKMESDQAADKADKKAQGFAAMYAVLMESNNEEVDSMTDEEVAREFKYEDVVEVTETEDGVKQIAVSEENRLIDDAIIESAEKSGTIDIENFNVENNMDNIRKDLATRLITQGVIAKDAELDKLITDLEEKVKDRQAIIVSERPHAVEEKMADDSITQAMAEDGLTSPDAVQDDRVAEIYNSKIEKMREGIKPSEEASSVIATMQGIKPDQTATFDRVEEIMRMAQEESAGMIQDRKSALSKKSKQKVSSESTDKMREALKRKKELELDSQILAHEASLEEGQTAGMQSGTVSDMLTNANGGLDPNADGSVAVGNSDKVLEMLNMQTQLYKSKENLERVGSRTTKEQKLRAFRAELYDEHGNIKKDMTGSKTFDTTKDGSKQLTSDGSIKIDTTTVGLDVDKLMAAVKAQKRQTI